MMQSLRIKTELADNIQLRQHKAFFFPLVPANHEIQDAPSLQIIYPPKSTTPAFFLANTIGQQVITAKKVASF